MNLVDWIVLGGTLGFIVLYGAWKTRKQSDLSMYLRGDRQQGWLTIGLGVMATQASAITFLSTPGQAFESGMGFIQFYFGLPIALVLVAVFIVPLFYRLNVYTAYEYLENRFDLKTRLLTAFLFLVQRGLAAGITIYAPAIVLSSALGWDLNALIVGIGLLVIIYTVSGGTKGVNLTQKWQMAVILGGMVFAIALLFEGITDFISLSDGIRMAGEAGKLEMISLSFDPTSRYTLWSGLTGGMFLALSYFGTDQSQVQRYIGARSIRESRMALMFNAVLKIPMQVVILATGVLLFVFYQVHERPVRFDRASLERLVAADQSGRVEELVARYLETEKLRVGLVQQESSSDVQGLKQLEHQQREIQTELATVSSSLGFSARTPDSDYVFIRFILDHLPQGIVGLLLAVILSAGMSSTSGELNALSTTTMRDFYQRLRPASAAEPSVNTGKFLTALWGILAIVFALSARMFENLIELVNILGSLFYGTILGVFICAIAFKNVRATAVFIAAIAAEVVVFTLFLYVKEIGYLWYNAIGAAVVVALALAMTFVMPRESIRHE